MQEIKLVLRDNNKVLETVIKETNTKPSNLAQSLEDFIRCVNDALTKIIQNHGGSSEVMEADDDEESDDDDEDKAPASPKKIKK